ncbi:hypothetical protein [Sphingomonas faeni]|uniref:hypothetical protein n=1 Tax=Sphingomonas faeni TaxID=185950 RepID=UPI0033629A6A
MVDQAPDVTREDALVFADEAFRNRDISFSGSDVVDMTAALGSFLARRLPCKSGEGAGESVRDAATKLLAAVDTRNMRGRDHVPSMRDEQTARARMAKALALTPDATQTREAEFLAGFDAATKLLDDSFALADPKWPEHRRAALNARGGA